jgi:hypothetical protein
MNKNDYVEKYLEAYKEMKKAAIEKIKNYGKELDVREICEKRYCEMSMRDGSEIYDEDIEEFYQNESYCCAFEGKHEIMYCVRIERVRYVPEKDWLEVYVSSDDGYVSEWLPESWIGFDSDAIYMTIVEFCE